MNEFNGANNLLAAERARAQRFDFNIGRNRALQQRYVPVERNVVPRSGFQTLLNSLDEFGLTGQPLISGSISPGEGPPTLPQVSASPNVTYNAANSSEGSKAILIIAALALVAYLVA